MPEPLVHFAAPLAVMLALGERPRSAILLSVLAVLPDLDVLLHVHRSITHSLVLTALPLLALALASPKGLRRTLLLACMSIASHPLLDLLTGYTPLLYPILPVSLWLKAWVNLRIASVPSLTPHLELLVAPLDQSYIPEIEVYAMTGEGVATALLILIPVALARVSSWRHA